MIWSKIFVSIVIGGIELGPRSRTPLLLVAIVVAASTVRSPPILLTAGAVLIAEVVLRSRRGSQSIGPALTASALWAGACVATPGLLFVIPLAPWFAILSALEVATWKRSHRASDGELPWSASLVDAIWSVATPMPVSRPLGDAAARSLLAPLPSTTPRDPRSAHDHLAEVLLHRALLRGLPDAVLQPVSPAPSEDPPLVPEPRSWAVRLVISQIDAYRTHVAPGSRRGCRYTPSCSHYVEAAVARHGALSGGLLGVRRLLRCVPYGGEGFDPCP